MIQMTSDMKRNLLNIFCYALIIGASVLGGELRAQSVSGQEIPNGDFSAEWETCYNGVGKQPAGWKASNVSQMGITKELVTRNSDGSVLLTNQFVGMLGIGSNAPAYISLGTPWVYANIANISKSDGGTTGGIAFTSRPDSIVGVFKRKVITQETAWVVLYLWKGTAVSYSPDNKELIDNETDVLAENGSVTLIGKAEYEIKGNLSDWSRISVPVTYFSDEIPEKMNVIISGADYRNRNKIKENNTLSVQSVQLVYEDPVSTETIQLMSETISVIDKILYIKGNYRNLAVYAIDGKQVYTSRFPKESISLSFLPAGVYTMRYDGENGAQSLKFVLR